MKLLQAARLSRLGDASTGLDKQDLDCQRYAELGSHEITHVCADSDVSGDTDPWTRPQLGPYLSDPQLVGTYDGIVASHVDRLARSTVHFMRLLHWADEHHKTIITTGEQGIDFSTPVGKLLGYIISWLGEQELAAIKRRSIATQRYLKDNDFLVGRPPWGYKIIDKGDHKGLAVDEDLKPYLRGMIDRALAGDTLNSICQWLDDSGIKPPRKKPWHPKSISQILHNPVLMGRRKNSSGKTDLSFDGLLSSNEFNALQTSLDNRPTRRGPVSSTTAMLTGVAVCASCGGPMYRFRAKTKRKDGTSNINTYYRCKGTDRNPSRCRNMVPLADLDAWVDEWFTGDAFGNTEIVERIILPGTGHEDDIASVEQDIRELDLDSPDFDSRLAALRTERSRLIALPTEPDQTIERPTGVLVKDLWPTLSAQQKRSYLLAGSTKVHASKDDMWITGDPRVLASTLRAITGI